MRLYQLNSGTHFTGGRLYKAGEQVPGVDLDKRFGAKFTLLPLAQCTGQQTAAPQAQPECAAPEESRPLPLEQPHAAPRKYVRRSSKKV